jgi:hypothetical protein
MREHYRRAILDALAGYEYPATINTVKRLLDAKHLHGCGWDTVEKYLQELAIDRLVVRQALPTERGHKPLIVYVGTHHAGPRAREFLGTFSTD